MTDDPSGVPPDQRLAAKPRREIQVVPGSRPKPSRPPAASHFGPRGGSGWRGPALARPPAPAAVDTSREGYWREEFRKLNEGLAKVETCRAEIPQNCSRTTCYSRYRYEWETSTCVGGWAIPTSCAEALKTPGRTVHVSWGSSKKLENFSCSPLRTAVEEAERSWQSKLDDLEARAGREGVPQNWRYD
jgi:hypothetical protein